MYFLHDVAVSSIHGIFVLRCLSYDIVITVHDDSDSGKPRERKGRQRRLRKKHHTVESDKEGSFQQHNIVDGKTKAQASESEGEEAFFISSFLKKKSAVKESKIDGPEMYPEKQQR